MKLNIILSIIVLTLLTLAQPGCSNQNRSFVHHPADTSFVWVSFVSPMQWNKLGLGQNQFYSAAVYRIIHDTAVYDTIDANTIKKIWARDTLYIAEVAVPLNDSLGNPKLDTAFKPIVNYFHPLIPKDNILQDYNKLPNKK